MSNTELCYRKTAVEGASPIGLMIALFDTLVGDLRRAASALRENDIQTRCREVNHAFLVLGRLESWLDMKNGGESVQTLSRFYAHLRAKMMQASATKSATLLDTEIEEVLRVRSAWQQLDVAPPSPAEMHSGTQAAQINSAYPPASMEMQERIPLSLSA